MRNLFIVNLALVSTFLAIPHSNATDNQPTQPKSELVHPRTQIKGETVPVSSDPKQIQEVLEKNKQNIDSKDASKEKKDEAPAVKKLEAVSQDKNNQKDGGNSPSGGPGGSVPGNIQASTVNVEPFSGSANMAYPIQVPPGRAGIQPNLALTYSSSFRGLGLAGVGWNLDLGSIQLSTKKGPPKYDGTEIVTLIENGSSQDLVYDSNVEFYRTESEGSFSKIVKDSTGWVISDKKGTKYYFGYTDDSRQYDSANSSHIFRWALNKVEDLSGNYMTITYAKDQGQLYPLTIYYTGNSQMSLNPYARIDINYENASTPSFSYMSGYKINTILRIKSISVSANDRMQSQYNLVYTQSPGTGRDLLQSITQLGADGISALPAITFSYQNTKGFGLASGWNIPNSVVFSNSDSKDLGIRIADINSDGYSDILRLYSVGGVEPGGSAQEYREIYINSKNNSWNLNQGWLPPNSNCYTGYICTNFISKYDSVNNIDVGARLVDVNGDGRLDFIQYFEPAIYLNDTWINWPPSKNNKSYLNQGNSFSDDLVSWHKPSNTEDVFLTINDIWHGDLFNHTDTYEGQGFYLGNIFSDINGDGYVDIVTSKTVQYNPSPTIVTQKNIYFNNIPLGGTGWALSSSFFPPNSSYTDMTDGATLVDLNGDGLPDFFYRKGSTSKTYMNTGSGWQEYSGCPWDNTFGYGDLTDGSTTFADINSDGLMDMIIAKGSLTAGSRVLINTGNGWKQDDAWVFPEGEFKNLGTQLLDANSDGMMDFMIHYNGNTPKLYLNQGNAADLLISVDNGIGAKSTITYDSATHFNNTFLPFAIPVVKSLTIGILNPIGASYNYTTNYSYSGGKWDAGYHEFQGFQTVKVTDSQGNYSQTTYLQDHWLKGRPLEQGTYDAQGLIQNKVVNQWQTQDITTNTTTHQTSKFAYLSRVDNYLYDGAATAKRTTQIFFYNENPQYGDVTQAFNFGEVDFATGNDIGSDKVVTFTEYLSNTSNWLIGLPKHVYVQDFNGNTLSQAWLYYDGSSNLDAPPVRGRVTNKVNWLGSSSQADPVTRYIYDVYGNVTNTVDPNGNMTTTVYDNVVHMFPIQMTNALGQTASKTYYGVGDEAQDKGLYGQEKTTTDSNNQTILTIYDSFGRPISSVSPLDSVALPTTQKIYQIFPTYTTITSKARVDSGSNQTIDSVEYYDGLGRLIEAKSASGNAGQYIVSGLTEYDSRGLPIKKYLPRFTSHDLNTLDAIDSSVPSSQVTYDAMGRTIAVTNPDGTHSNVQYNHWMTTTIDENGHMQKSYMDAYGRLIQKEEYTGADGRAADYPVTPYTLYATTNYTYDPLGRLISVKDAQNNITTIQYDYLGRKISMNDLDMGNWQYSYDANGNMLEQTDAKGKKIRFTYDALNRLINKAEAIANPTFNVNYAYDQVGQSNSIGRLGKVDYNNGAAGFIYDEWGREVSSSKNIDGRLYRVNREYDLLNRIKVLTYPNGQQIKYLYNQAGQVIFIGSVQPQDEMAALKPATDDPNQILLALNDVIGIRNAYGDTTMQLPGPYVNNVSYNALGQITQIQYANKVTTAYTYNPLNSRLTRIYTSNAQGDKLQDLNYTYDALGQITSITDAVHTATQQYKYDALNRLIYAQGSYGVKNYVYDSIGNIIQKDGLTYSYGEPNSRTDGGKAGPHAVTSLSDGTTFKYDLNGNMVTIKKGVDTTTYLYDVQNRLIEIDTQKTGPSVVAAKYYYDGDGGRTKKVVTHRDTAIYNITGSLYRNLDGTPFPATNQKPDTVTTRYIGNLVEDEDHGTTGVHRRTNFIYMGGTRVAAQANDNVLYYHNDYLGGANVLSDQAGLKRDLTEYDPFGLVVRHERYGKDFATIWSGFTSKNLDDESGLMFYGARYYNPKLGRFITADTIVQSPGNPQTLNRYTYCNNNPVNNIDPTGHSWFKKWFGKIVGVIAGIVAGIATGNFMVGFQVYNMVSSGITAIQTGNIAGFVGSVIGGAIGASAGISIAGSIARNFAPSLGTFFAIGAAEMGTAGFGSAFVGSLASGASLGQAFKTGLQSGAVGAVIGGIIETTYLSGIQNQVHGMSKEQYAQNLAFQKANPGVEMWPDWADRTYRDVTVNNKGDCFISSPEIRAKISELNSLIVGESADLLFNGPTNNTDAVFKQWGGIFQDFVIKHTTGDEFYKLYQSSKFPSLGELILERSRFKKNYCF